MIKRLIQLLKTTSAASESDTSRNGFLSYAAETHALGIGIYTGLTSRRLRARTVPENPDVEAEPHYFKGGYVIGTLIQAALIGLGLYAGVMV